MGKGISERGLERTQVTIKQGKILNPKTETVNLLIKLHKENVLHEN
jgi:hypothetical protein